MIARLALLLGGAALGLVSGVATTVLHQVWGWLFLGLVAAVAVVHWVGPGACRIGFAAGWTVVVLRGALTTPAGDYLVAANAPGWTLLAASLALVVFSLATVRPGGGACADPRDQPSPT